MPPGSPTIVAGAIAKLLATLPALGVEARSVCASAGFDVRVAGEVDARVPLSTLHALWEAVAAAAPRADLALLVAERYRPGDYGLVGFVAMTSPSLGEALAQVERYMRLWTDDPGLRLRDDGRLEVVYRTSIVDRPGLHRATEATVAEIVHGARLVAQRRVGPREVRFRHPPPAEREGREAFEAFFGAPVLFGQGETEMRFDPAELATPLPEHDAQLGVFLRGLASDAMTSRAPPGALIDRVRETLAEDLRRGVPSSEATARRLAMSGRTLRRRLEEEGTTYREVLDRTRAEMARCYVRDPRVPLSEVAFLLGFSEPSAFNRAFKRWTRLTPGTWRRRHGRPD